MATTHRQPIPSPTPDYELSAYPSSDPYPTSSAHPLLDPSSSSAATHTYPLDEGDELHGRRSPPLQSRKRRKTRDFSSGLKRYWKPLVLLSTPFLLLSLYGLVHPHIPGLPPLPRVKLQLGDSTADTDIVGAGIRLDNCVCGHTDEGDRLCKVYRQEGLEASRLVKGTGNRLRKVLQKARDGVKVKVGVLGGSGECSRAQDRAWYHQSPTERCHRGRSFR